MSPTTPPDGPGRPTGPPVRRWVPVLHPEHGGPGPEVDPPPAPEVDCPECLAAMVSARIEGTG